VSSILRPVANALAVVFIVIAAGYGVGAATQAGILIPAAIPFSLVLIAITSRFGPTTELLAWAAITAGLLAGTYLGTGSPIEYVVFLVYLALSALGVLASPLFLAAAWLIHPLWDLLPRTLTGPSADLPVACMLFDTPIGIYLAWAWRRGRLTALGEPRDRRRVLVRLGRVAVGVTAAALASTALASAPGTAYLNAVALVSGLVVIVGFRVLGRSAELIAWAILTGWLGMTYAHTGGVLDAAVFFAYVAVAAIGAFRTPYALAAAWLAFIPWSFSPHHLQHMPADFPVATIFYCLPPGLYLVLGARSRRWQRLGAPTSMTGATALPAAEGIAAV
jgi:hypothetical protein